MKNKSIAEIALIVAVVSLICIVISILNGQNNINEFHLTVVLVSALVYDLTMPRKRSNK